MITHKSGAAWLLIAALGALLPWGALHAENGGKGREASRPAKRSGSGATRAITFTENIGQWDAGVRFQGTAGSTSIRFENGRVSYLYLVDSLAARGKGGRTAESAADASGARDNRTIGYRLSTEFIGGLPGAAIDGESPTGTLFNYYLGPDASRWHVGARGFEGVRYRGIYPGIDAHYYGHDGGLKYDFILSPGADHRQIHLRYNGAGMLTILPTGEMEVVTAFGSVKEAAPYSYQVIGGRRVEVDARYRLLGPTSYGFAIGKHDPRYPVVIDPCLSVEYATYLGGGSFDMVTSMAVDSSGASYAIGFTRAPDFPVLPSQELEQLNYVFISKLSADGSQLLYSTVIAETYEGTYEETPTTILFESLGEDVEVTPGGEAVIALTTNIDSLPTTPGAYKRFRSPQNINSTCGPPIFDNYDAYVVRLNSNGQLKWGTYLGGSDNDYVSDIALHGNGEVLLTGMTYAPVCGTRGDALSFPTTVPRDRFGSADTLRGFETYISRLSADGRSLPFSAIYGGTRDEFATRIALDPGGDIFLLGSTNSTDLPTTANAYQGSAQPGLGASVFDLYIARINTTTAQLVYSTYFSDQGGAGRQGLGIAAYVRRSTHSMVGGFRKQERRQGLVLDRALGDVVIFGGSTRSTGLPATGGAFQGGHRNPAAGEAGYDCYVVRLNTRTNQILAATYLGGTDADMLGGLGVDKFGDIVVGLSTRSSDFPLSPVNIQDELRSDVDAVAATISPDATRLTYASYYGGTLREGTILWEQSVSGITVDREGAIYMYGGTASRDIPITPQAIIKQNDYYGGYIVKFSAPTAAKVGIGLGLEFEPNTCGDLQTQTQLLFNSGQLPLRVDNINFKVGKYFRLVNPPSFPFTLAPCDTLTLTVGFTGGDLECRTRATDSMVITAPGATNPRVTMNLIGRRSCLNFHFEDTSVVIDYYKLGSNNFVGFGINVRGDETQYLTIVPDPGNSGIFTPASPIVNRTFQEGTSGIAFSVNAKDTGYYCETFTATIEPCHRVMKLSICAHVKSGIFTAAPSVDYGLISCKEIFEPFVVRNTGNDSLTVSISYVGGPHADDVNFADDVQKPRRIGPQDSTIFNLYIRPIGAGKHESIVVFKTDEGGSEDGRQRWVYLTSELDSVALSLGTIDVVGGFGEVVTLPIEYTPILEGRVPLEELTLYAKFDPKLLDIVGLDVQGALMRGWEMVENKYVDSGAIFKLRKGVNGETFAGRSGRLANIQIKVLRGDTIASPLDLKLAGASKGCLYAEIDSGRVFQLNAECAAALRLLFTGRQLLKQSIPNPASSTVTIPYSLHEPAYVTLVVYDALGREALRLIDGNLPAGDAQLTFDTRALAPGRYYYRLTVGDDLAETRTMVIER